MQDWRFDELTRTLGKATSRRQVLKGLVGGIAAALVGRPANAPKVDAAGGCSQAACEKAARDRFNYQIETTCKSFCTHTRLNHSGGACLGCLISANLQLSEDLRQCREHGGCPSGLECCNGACVHIGSDQNNCGTCGNHCDSCSTCNQGNCESECSADQLCQDGKCICPAGTSECSGPWNTTCCQPGERCVTDPVTFGVSCDAVCGPCEDYHPNDPNGPCVPRECDVCQECDPSSDQCVPASDGTACGSGLVCCKGACVDGNCNQNQTFNPDTCKCECPPVSCPDGQSQDPNTCECACDTGETCGPFCCSSNKVCCPDAVSGKSCRDPNGNCGCNTPCADDCCDLYTEECCRSTDYTYHCIPKGGGSC